MKTFIAALIGMIILFVFQALSWMILPIHKNAFTYTKDQDAIMTVLAQNLHEDGIYRIPAPAPDATSAQHEDFMKKGVGKPYAILNYHTSMNEGMTNQMIFGLLFDLICILLVIMVLNRAPLVFSTFGSRLMLVMTFSIFLAIAGPLTTWNWWGYPAGYVIGDVIDIIIGWLLCGMWLAWYLGRKPVNS